MGDHPIVFAMANPDPEINRDTAFAGGAYIYGSGRSDDPNQINNCLVFPGLMSGLMRSSATTMTPAMKKSAAIALANTVVDHERSVNHILPSIFEKGISDIIADAVIKTLKEH